MKDGHVLIAIIMIVASLVIGLLAWLIKYRKMATLISGYDPDQYTDPDGLCNWIGGTLLKTAMASLITAVLMFFFSKWLFALAMVFAAIILVGAFTAAIGGQRFKVKK